MDISEKPLAFYSKTDTICLKRKRRPRYLTLQRAVWHLLESVLDPKANDPDSVMPDLGFTEERAKTLLVFLLSLDETYIPHEYRTVLQK